MLAQLSACGDFQEAFNPRTSADLPQNESPSTGVSRKKSSGKTEEKIVNDLLAGDSDGEEFLNRPTITTKSGTYYFVKSGDTLTSISRKLGYTADELAQINDLYDAQLVVGRRIFAPVKRNKGLYITSTLTTKQKKISEVTSQKGLEFIWPVTGGVVTSPFGYRRGRPHDGIDISARSGTPIHAAADGKVIFAKRFAGYGNLVVIKHRKNYFTAYAHAENITISMGSKVKQGQQIATVGSTGHSTGPHLHFEIRRKTDPTDPLGLLPKNH